ncbi:MAG: hypothetical protein ACRD12_11990, partial [Acidimicrobiales bacterium]
MLAVATRLERVQESTGMAVVVGFPNGGGLGSGSGGGAVTSGCAIVVDGPDATVVAVAVVVTGEPALSVAGGASGAAVVGVTTVEAGRPARV